MTFFTNLILAAQMLSAIGMIGLILVQHGKGADMGAAFGSGSSGSLFGASGSANFLSHFTAGLAGVFFVTTMALTYISSQHLSGSDAPTTVPGFAAPVMAPEVPGSSLAPATPASSAASPGAVAAPGVPADVQPGGAPGVTPPAMPSGGSK